MRVSFVMFRQFHSCFTTVRNLTTSGTIPRVCIVGSGPAGWYTSRKLIRLNEDVTVDLFEKLPVPFGLIRYGVAPDHPAIKKAENEFTKYADHPRLRYIGNVNVGSDVSVEDLQKAYHAVVFSYGSPSDKQLGIPGEEHVLSAPAVVGWYNGDPKYVKTKINLDCEEVAIIGHGNVALDIARLLLRSVDDLRKTDISEYALAELSKSRVKRVTTIGRRGPLQISFTTLEMREMITLPEFNVILNPEVFASILPSIPKLQNPTKRLLELLADSFAKSQSAISDKQWCIEFLRSPIAATKEGKTIKLELGINKLETDEPNSGAKPTGRTETRDFGLVIRSVGYSAEQIDSFVPVDANRAKIPNKMSRVDGKPGLYCSGWIQGGPVGVLLSTRNGSYDTAKVINQDIVEKALSIHEPRPGFELIEGMLKQKGLYGIKRHVSSWMSIQTVSFGDWLKIDKVEKERGAKLGKPREKIVNIPEMLEIARE
uniref:NADPH:adrenodoxin oxidoreductase, mitochondrial n=1 Tax=Strigamia maritima TaxID=126957 RepID=T1IYD1_STRMM